MFSVKRKENNRMKFAIMMLLTFLTIIGACSSTDIKSDNDYFYEVYNLEETQVDLIKLEFEDLMSLKKDFSGVIYFSRNDCEFCFNLWDSIIEHFNSTQIVYDRLYVLETNPLTEDEKAEMADKFSVFVVPTVLKFRDGKIVLTEIGEIPIEELDALFGIEEKEET